MTPRTPGDGRHGPDGAGRHLAYRSAEGDPALYLVLALRDRRQLMACPADARALMTWGERLLSFPDAGGLGQARLTDLLELELRS